MDNLRLPDGFLIGAATASYQVEGASYEDGRTDCIWDTFSRVPGAVYAGNDGKVACDQYNRYKEDIDIMAKLGFEAYRFSVAWSRIIPHADGKVNAKGIRHYQDMIDYLHSKGMKATCTVFHWDLPQYLQDKGGWENRATAEAFAVYARTLFESFKDSIDSWITINEPFCICHLGHLLGVHAPGKKDVEAFTKAVHNVNLAHGLALREYRAIGLKAPIGITLNPSTPRPATRRAEDVKAARIATDFETNVFLDPLMGSGYPAVFDKSKADIRKGDMELIAGKIDFLGINFYNEIAVEADSSAPLGYSGVPNWSRLTDIGWPITPDGLMNQLRYLSSKTGTLPFYITENGYAAADRVENGKVHDYERIDYLLAHLKVCQAAVEEGIPLKGYYVWSFIDNFEWAEGYSKRFGIVYCDYKTMERIPKDSAYFMRDVIARN
jgi:beta-galactosidase